MTTMSAYLVSFELGSSHRGKLVVLALDYLGADSIAREHLIKLANLLMPSLPIDIKEIDRIAHQLLVPKVVFTYLD